MRDISNQPQVMVTPNSLDAERGCLGVSLSSPEDFGKIVAIVQPDDFFLPAHRWLFDGMVTVWESGRAISLITVTEAVKSQGRWKDIGGDWSADDYVRGLLDIPGQPAKAEEYAEIIRSLSLRRKMLFIAKHAETQALRDGADGDEVVRDTEKAMQSLFEGRLVTQVVELPPLVDERLAEAARRQEKSNSGLLTGLSTGFDTLDYLTCGLQPKTFNVIAARPGVGKSQLSLQIADHVATELGLPVLFFSLEMSKEEMADRLIVSRSGIDAQRWKTGAIHPDEWRTLNNVRDKFRASKLVISDNPNTTIGDMWNQCQRFRKKEGLSLILVDYLQLMTASKVGQNRQSEISEISRNLKKMAKDMEVPLIALSQLNRNVEYRSNGKPTLADIRECVVGDTKVVDADTGRLMAIMEVKSGDNILGVDTDQKVVKRSVSAVWSTGVKPVFKLTTRTGKTITATDNHPLLTPSGWKNLGDLIAGDVIGTALRMWANSDLLWEDVLSIEPDGEQEVYDISVPGCGNFLANGIVAHNSGAIEQDADMVMFIHNPNKSEVGEMVDVTPIDKYEITIAKHRSGPCGEFELGWQKQQAKFVEIDDYHHSPEYEFDDVPQEASTGQSREVREMEDQTLAFF